VARRSTSRTKCGPLTHVHRHATGVLYLVGIIDWATRRVLSWRLSNTLTAGFCVEALSEALARFGKPDILNTDQGAQFTSDEFTKMLRDHGIQISMDAATTTSSSSA
jgi:putative transposase